jgi:hypothetical protein
MQTSNGWFIYLIITMKKIDWTIKIPYIRWGQAWMLRALTQFYDVVNKKGDKI